MIIAAHHTLKYNKEKKTGLHIKLNMTSTTGLSITFILRYDSKLIPVGKEVRVDWGDGNKETLTYANTSISASHTYSSYGHYTVIFYDSVLVPAMRILDGHDHYDYEKAILSVVDYSNTATGIDSGAFKYCNNLTKAILPAINSCGQRSFGDCSNLERVVIKDPNIYYDGTFENCQKLTSFTVNYNPSNTRQAQCWHYVWATCSALTELHVGRVSQFGNGCFTNCTHLTDVYIDNHTINEIKNSFGKSYAFPWGAGSTVKFHGTDGYVLGDGTLVPDE